VGAVTTTVPDELPIGSVPLSDEWGSYRTAIIELQPEAWQTITPLNSWNNIGGSYAPFGYRYWPAWNSIMIRGNLEIGTADNGVIIGNVPDPHRPTAIQGWPVTAAGAGPKIELDPDGNLKMWDYTTGLYVAFSVVVSLDA
jgi:hypothetical protein